MADDSHPKVLISYSWDSPQHRDWVRRLSERLRLGGVDVILDQWHVKPGESFTQFMEQAVVRSDYVVVVLTPAYARKANERRGGVGYEQQIVSGQIMAGIPRSKFIPVVRSGRYEHGPRCAIPSHFAGIASIDFRRDKEFDEKLEELLRALHARPKFVPPALGDSPFPAAANAPATERGRGSAAAPDGAAHPRGGGTARAPWGEMQAFYFESFDAADAEVDGIDVLRREVSHLWLPYEDEVWSATITGGVYKLVNSADPKAVRYQHFRVADLDMSQSPVSVEVGVESPEGNFVSGAGLIYRFDRESRNYYAFVLTGEGKFVFYLRRAGAFGPLYSGRSDAIRRGQFNKAALSSRGELFDLYINDTYIKTVKNSELGAGDVGVIAIGAGEFSFDNLAAYDPL